MYTNIITASTGKNSDLTSRIENTLQAQNRSFQSINLASLPIPVYTQDAEATLTENPAQSLYTLMQGANSLIIVTPEYNYTMPPALTSALCWASRIDANFRACFQNKPVILASFSYSGSQNLLVGLRTMMMNLGGIVMGQALIDTPNSPLTDDVLTAVIQRFSQLITP